jgi:hypothetical protein
MQNLTDTFLEGMLMAFDNQVKDSESLRIKTFQDFQTLYEKDYLEIVKIVKAYFMGKPYSLETLNKMFFEYQDIIQKVLKRLTGGILSPAPNVDYEVSTTKDGEVILSEDFEAMLETSNFIEKLVEIFRQSIYYNTVIAEAVWRDDKVEIDIITGANCSVETGSDYLKIEEIATARIGEDKHIIVSFWDKENHYLTKGGERYAPDDNEKMINPYGVLPFSVLRIKEGTDFWGQPNWGLFLFQLSYILKKSDNFLGEAYQKFPLLWGENAQLPKGFVIGPGSYLNIDNPNSPGKTVSLNSLSHNTNWESIINLQEHSAKQFFVNEGLPASTASTESKDLSGKAKEIDTLELFEERPFLQMKLKNFAIDLLNKMVMVHNYHSQSGKIPENGKVIFNFNEDETLKTQDEIIKEREMQKKYFIADEIDFIMQDLDCSEDEAIEHYKKRKERLIQLSGDTLTTKKSMTFGEILQSLAANNPEPETEQTDETGEQL